MTQAAAKLQASTVPSGKTSLKTVYTASDLHMFCKRSEAPRHMDMLYDAAQNADVFVLNGDIFDFRWSTLKSTNDTVDKALTWLDDFINRVPGCKVHYVLGNHDSVKSFTDALGVYAREKDNLLWHPYYVRLKDTIFLHGDVAQKKMDAEDLTRFREGWYFDKKKGKWMNRIYDAAFLMKVHKGIHKVAFPNRITVERVRHYLDQIGEGPDSGTSTVYFGHTHVAMSDYEHDGVLYHNTGAPLKGLPFNILKTEIEL